MYWPSAKISRRRKIGGEKIGGEKIGRKKM
jgi:hypothetical protein